MECQTAAPFHKIAWQYLHNTEGQQFQSKKSGWTKLMKKDW